jgi:hypothetical protein
MLWQLACAVGGVVIHSSHKNMKKEYRKNYLRLGLFSASDLATIHYLGYLAAHRRPQKSSTPQATTQGPGALAQHHNPSSGGWLLLLAAAAS